MRVRAPLVIVAGAILLRLGIGVGFANYDTLYSLAWGQQIARGQNPSYGANLAPTPHPLLEALGVVLAPLGAKATLAIVVALAIGTWCMCRACRQPTFRSVVSISSSKKT